MDAKSNFPEDLLEAILSRLTVRQLLQLRCISKLWCSTIDKDNFIQKQCRTLCDMLNEESNIPLFCDKPSVFGLEDDPAQFYLLSKKLETDINILCLTSDLRRDSSPYFAGRPNLFNSLICAGDVNGVVLLHWKGECLGLWNPATREFKAIPNPRPNQPDSVKENIASFLGMGFDPKCNDFKVVRSIHWMIRRDTDWERTYIYELYSLRANSWKIVKIPCDSLSIHQTIADGYFNGVHYWPANELDINNFNARHSWILSFNFSTEVFKLVDHPPLARKDGPGWEWCIGKYMEFLAAIVTSRNLEDNVSMFEIWIVTKFADDDQAVPVSWQYLICLTLGQSQRLMAYGSMLFYWTVMCCLQSRVDETMS